MTWSRILVAILVVSVVVPAAIVYRALTRDQGRTWTVTIHSSDGRATSGVTFRDRDEPDSAAKHVAEAIRRHCDQFGSTPDAAGVVYTVETQGVLVEAVESEAPPGRSGSGDATLTETITISSLSIRLRPDGRYELCRLEGGTIEPVAGAWGSPAEGADALAQRIVERARAAARASDEASELP